MQDFVAKFAIFPRHAVRLYVISRNLRGAHFYQDRRFSRQAVWVVPIERGTYRDTCIDIADRQRDR